MPTRVPERDFCDAFHPEYVQLVPLATNDGAGGAGEGGEREGERVYICQDGSRLCQYIHWSQYILSISSYLFFYGFQEALTQADTSTNDLDEWKLYCKLSLLLLVLICRVLVCHLCFWALSLCHVTTFKLNSQIQQHAFFIAVKWPSAYHLFLKFLFFFSFSFLFLDSFFLRDLWLMVGNSVL